MRVIVISEPRSKTHLTDFFMSKNDPFREQRNKEGVLRCPFQGENIPMLLRHKDVQQAAKDWQTYSSDVPFRVPIPSEESLRTMRQLPIETNPPEHTEYRAIVEPFFKRYRNPEVIAKVENLIDKLLDHALAQSEVEIVDEFSLPLQCHALTYLLDVEENEAELWLEWGMHVFDKEGGENDSKLEVYLEKRFKQAQQEPDSEDFFSTLINKAEYQGKKLTWDEAMGFANLTFAGGRDTVIHTISSIFAHFAKHPEGIDFLRENPKKINNATEEFFRVVSPLTHIGRVCPVDTELQPGESVAADDRVSLCWVSANHDEEVFENPNQLKLDRKPNPHIAFGAGHHFCLGAGHARLLVKTLLKKLTEKVSTIDLVEAVKHVETEAEYTREVGFDKLRVKVE